MKSDMAHNISANHSNVAQVKCSGIWGDTTCSWILLHFIQAMND